MAKVSEGALLGIGNPLLDISAVVDEALLTKYGLKPDDAILAEEKHMPLYKELVDKYKSEFIAGGSAQNAVRVAQWILQVPNVASYFGCVGNDENAKILEAKARSDGVNVFYQVTDKEPTGTCAVLITGANRSLVANLAAANCTTIDHIQKPENKEVIEKSKIVYISGYFLTVNPEIIQTLAEHCLTTNKMFVMNLSAPFLCQFFKEPLMNAMPYVDVLFGNETEALTFAKEQNLGTENLKEIAQKISKLPKKNIRRPRVVVISQGKDPVLFADGQGEVKEYPVQQLDPKQIIDTNGAGDAFTGGFLAQLVQCQPYDVCIKCGIWCASEVIQRSGCTFEGKPAFKP